MHNFPKHTNIEYNGNNLLFLDKVKEVLLLKNDDVLFRASEFGELDRIWKFGTDRGGFNNGKKWRDTDILFEDVIFGTTISDIIEGETDENVSTSFKKFEIIDEPILLIYDINGFENVGYHEWKFKEPDKKLDSLKQIIILC